MKAIDKAMKMVDSIDLEELDKECLEVADDHIKWAQIRCNSCGGVGIIEVLEEGCKVERDCALCEGSGSYWVDAKER